MEFPSESLERDSKESGKQNFLRQPRQAMPLVSVTFVNCMFISFESEWYTKYLADELSVLLNNSLPSYMQNLEQVSY